MKSILSLALAALLTAPLSGNAANVRLNSKCDFHSAYELEVDEQGVGFSRKAKGGQSPARIAMSTRGVTLDGQALPLSAADHQRVRQFEAQLRALVPQVRAIASDAVEIAFIALNQVVAHFAKESSREALVAELEALQEEALLAIASARSSRALSTTGFEQRIESAVKRIVPVIAGEFASQAIAVALSGDENAAAEIERRANELGRQIEHSVEGAAKALELRAAALCPQIEALDAIDNSFEWRLPDGSRPELLEMRTGAAVAKS